MAEAVQQKLEDQVEELHDLRQRGLFSKSEIAYVLLDFMVPALLVSLVTATVLPPTPLFPLLSPRTRCASPSLP